MPALLTFTRLLEPQDAAWRALMDVYITSFEDDQRETEAGLLSNLTTPQNPTEGGHVVIAATVDRGPCVGGVIFSYLSAIDCGYASYLFVAEEWRRRAIGTGLLNEMRARLQAEAMQRGRSPVRGVFTEIQRERHADTVAHARLRFWARNRILPLAVAWEYPPLHEDGSPAPTYLAFGPYGPGPATWRPDDLERVANAIFEATYSYLPSAPATLASIVETLRRLPRGLPVEYLRPV